MKDPSMPDSKSRKKFMFYDSEKRQADLRIRLQYDGINQSYFFRAMITGYLDKDPDILSFLDRYKGKNKTQGINKRAASNTYKKRAEQTKKQFSLDSNDIENIFDIIAEEHPDL